MAREPELSIKVGVAPVIDGEKIKNDIQNQINNVRELPKVNVDINVGDFSKSLSDHMKTELKEVNKKVSYYLSTMTQNVDGLNKVANNLFSDVNFSNRIQKQFDDVYIQFDQFKKQLEDTKEVMSSIFNDTDFLSVNDFEKSLSNVQKEIETLYNKAFRIDKDHFKTDDFEKTFHNVISKISPDLEKITKAINNISGLSESNSDILKRLGMSEDDFMDATENIGALGDSLSELIEFSKNADFSDKGIKSFFLSIGRNASEMDGLFKSALSDVNELELSVDSKYKAIEEAHKKTIDARKENLSGGFDKEKVNEMSQAYLKAMGVLVNQQRILNTTKRSTIELEDNLLTKTKEVSTEIGEEVSNLKTLFNEVSKSDIGKQIPAVSEYMKSKAELEASKNIENAKSLSLNVNSSSAKEYETTLKGIKDRINELGKEGAFDGLNNNIDENERAFINAKEYIKDYSSALDEVKLKSRDTKLPQQRTTGLNVSNIENYSQKVTTIKNDLYALKDTVFPAVYSDINRTYGHLFDDSIINVQSYIDKLNEVPAAALSKAPAKTQHNKKAETIDSTNIKNYAALLNGIQGAMNDMKTTVVPDFDKVLSENGKKIADIGANLVNYVAVLKRGLKAVDQAEKDMADKAAKKSTTVPAKNSASVKKPYAQKTQDTKTTINSNEVVVTGDPVNIPGKVTLKVEDVTPPKGSVKIPGKVELKVSDITPPKTAVKLEGKVSNVTVDDSAKSKKKNAKDDVKKPEVIDLKGKVELKDEDIKRPDPLKLNGSVKIKAADVKIDDVEISKKEFDIKGNLILENAEIVNAVKEAAGEAAKVKKKNKPAENSGGESELLLQKAKDSKDVNDKQTQQAKKILSDAFIEQTRAYADGLKESAKYNNDDISESAKTARKQMQDAFDSANDKFLELLDVLSGDEIDQLTLKAKKELDSANRIVDRRIANLTDNNNKHNLFVKDRQKASDQIRAAIEKNSNNMDRARKNGSAGSDLYSQFNAKQTIYKALEGAVSSGSGVKDWAKTYFPAKVDDINNVTDALREMRGELTEDQIKLAQVSADKSIERSTNKAATAVANLKSQIHDYLETNKKIQNSELAQPFRELMNALNSENAPEKVGELQKQFAELRARSKELGLETESLIDKFEKLFGTHLSTMITMAALHKMQDAIRLVYQNVVEIDTAVTELRKVSEYTGKSLEEYMGRAVEQAQKLGVSISDYINSTADWKRLGYSDEDAENMATYSTLLKNVGDGIDDVNTSSSYLISTLQGFGLLADQAEDVVNKIDAVANTQPVTAKDLGEILTRSSAAMSAANNTLEETIALGTAANAVIQDADTVGTTLKSLSMYLRAAKSDAENAGVEVDGMANSVSELRSELKSLTGVDIMLDSKNFKSTYQIMKELSQVWSGLSDVTQANVTEMIGGKRNANAVSAILNNFDVAESAMESAANSANVAWEENDEWLNSIQGRLNQLDASFQALSTDVLDSDLVKTVVSLATGLTKAADAMIKFTGAIPMSAGIATFATQLGEPKMTGFMIVPSNTLGGDTEQVLRRYYIIYSRSMREYLVKPTNMVA